MNRSTHAWLMMAAASDGLESLANLPTGKQSNYDKDKAQMLRNERRAKNLNKALERGEQVTEESRQWLAEYEAEQNRSQ